MRRLIWTACLLLWLPELMNFNICSSTRDVLNYNFDTDIFKVGYLLQYCIVKFTPQSWPHLQFKSYSKCHLILLIPKWRLCTLYHNSLQWLVARGCWLWNPIPLTYIYTKLRNRFDAELYFLLPLWNVQTNELPFDGSGRVLNCLGLR